jgi:arsenate reductase
MRILIVCTGNSCRSQMAEYYLKSYNSKMEVFSAGSKPEKVINPRTIVVMREDGIQMNEAIPNHINEFISHKFDYVITVCGNAERICPVFIGEVKNRLHIGFEDPASANGTDEEVLLIYRKIRDQIKDGFYQFYQEILKAQL